MISEHAIEVTDCPKVAVLMAVCNGACWLPEQINSILDQVGVDVTLFISVDPSADRSVEVVQHFMIHDERIVVLPSRIGLQGAAHNFFYLSRFLKCHDFDFVAFSDQDDIWLPAKLKEACCALQCEGCDAYSSDVLAFWSDGKTKMIRKSLPGRRFDFLFEAGGPGCTYCVTSTAFQEFQHFLEQHEEHLSSVSFHDFLIYSFGRFSGWVWIIQPGGHLLYRQHAGNVVGANFGYVSLLRRCGGPLFSAYLRQVAFNLKFFLPQDSIFSLKFLIRHVGQLRRNRIEGFLIASLVILNFSRVRNMINDV